MKNEEDISVEAFRRILHENGDARRAEILEKTRRMNEISKTATFKELIAMQEKWVGHIVICDVMQLCQFVNYNKIIITVYMT